MRTYSATYTAIIEMLYNNRGRNDNVYSSKWEDGKYERASTGHTATRLPQAIVITCMDFTDTCSDGEIVFINRVLMKQLKEYNILWEATENIRSKSNNRLIIKRLVANNILKTTETRHIYIVNPLYIRRGDFFTVLTTTANMLKDKVAVSSDEIVNKRPVNKIEFDKDSKIVGFLRKVQ